VPLASNEITQRDTKDKTYINGSHSCQKKILGAPPRNLFVIGLGGEIGKPKKIEAKKRNGCPNAESTNRRKKQTGTDGGRKARKKKKNLQNAAIAPKRKEGGLSSKLDSRPIVNTPEVGDF